MLMSPSLITNRFSSFGGTPLSVLSPLGHDPVELVHPEVPPLFGHRGAQFWLQQLPQHHPTPAARDVQQDSHSGAASAGIPIHLCALQQQHDVDSELKDLLHFCNVAWAE